MLGKIESFLAISTCEVLLLLLPKDIKSHYGIIIARHKKAFPKLFIYENAFSRSTIELLPFRPTAPADVIRNIANITILTDRY